MSKNILDNVELNNNTVDTEKLYEFVARITYSVYYNHQSNYGIYEFTSKEKLPCTSDYLTGGEKSYIGCLCGNMQELMYETDYKVKAKLKYNAKYKKYDYSVENILCEQPKTSSQQQKFLEVMVTQKQASTILNIYPNAVEDILQGKKLDCNKLSGIGEKTLNKIEEKILDNYIIQDVLVLLRPLGITYTTIKKMLNYESNPSLLRQKLEENPYILTSIHGLGFKKVDDLALKLSPDLRVSTQRVKAYLSYKLKSIANSEGHTWLKRKDLIGYVRKDLKECVDIYKDIVGKEQESPQFLYVDEDKIGLMYFYNKAKGIVEQLNYLDSVESMLEPFTEEEMNCSIAQTEKQLGFKFTDEQVNAIKSVNERNVVIITAPAGAGKSSSIKGIFNLLSTAKIKEKFLYSEFNQIHEEDQLKKDEFDLFGDTIASGYSDISATDDLHVIKVGQSALSAKAAKRMKELSGQPASTMHRMLGYDGEGFGHDKNSPMKYHVNIWDEASMVNKSLTSSYLNAIRPHSKLVIIFDFAQLPPIGSGDFTRDLLDSQFCINKFTKVHRQGEESGILMDANKIRVGINPIEKFERQVVHGALKDMYYVFDADKEKMRNLAIKYYLKSVEDVGLDEAVIVTPRKSKSTNSSFEINKIIQDKLLPDSPYVTRWKDGEKCLFKLGAKVMQKKNNYDTNVFNGDEGYITAVGKNNVDITFNESDKEHVVRYSIIDLDQIELSYAISVHSGQGSQYHSVICVFDMSSYMMLNRRILYTAITRAKKKCMLISEPRAFKACLDDENNVPRQTFLAELLHNKI